MHQKWPKRFRCTFRRPRRQHPLEGWKRLLDKSHLATSDGRSPAILRHSRAHLEIVQTAVPLAPVDTSLRTASLGTAQTHQSESPLSVLTIAAFSELLLRFHR